MAGSLFSYSYFDIILYLRKNFPSCRFGTVHWLQSSQHLFLRMSIFANMICGFPFYTLTPP
jgi:hypothetical protein